MAMTDAQVKALKVQGKKYAVSDGHGLILEVRPNGAKYWIVRMWRNGKEIRRHLGSYPQMSVKEARIKAAEEHDRISEKKGKSITLGELTEEWLKTRMTDKNPSYLKSIRIRLRLYILPEFGNTPVTEINSADILNLCRKLEERGTIETAARVKVLIGQIIRYAIATNRAVNDPTTALKNALATRQHKHMAALTKPLDIALLMKNINAYPRTLIRCALKFSALTFCRPGEIRHI